MFTQEQIKESAQAALDHVCPHVDPEMQRQSLEDPEEGGLLCMVCAKYRELGYMIEQLLLRDEYEKQKAQADAAGVPMTSFETYVEFRKTHDAEGNHLIPLEPRQ